MLDVHILNFNPDPKHWEQCINSVNIAIQNTSYPIKLHITNGNPNFGEARAEGYSLGTYPYVTFVDNDDYVLPHAFAVLENALKENPDAIFTKELQLGLDGQLKTVIVGRHHLQIYKRTNLIDHVAAGNLCDLKQLRSVEHKFCIDLPDQVYVWRIKKQPRIERFR